MKLSNQHQQTKPVEVLGFVKNGGQAMIVTDGDRTRSYELNRCQEHDDLKRAIAYLESQGYQIIMDEWV